MPPIHKTLLIAFLLSFAVARSSAQTTVNIQFNEKGQITNPLPPFITVSDKLNFSVLGTQPTYENQVLSSYKRYLEVIKNLNLKDDDGHFSVLQQAGLEGNGYAIAYLLTLQGKIARQLISLLDDAKLRAIIAKGRNPDDDLAKLLAFQNQPGQDDELNIHVPDIKALMLPVYVISNFFKDGIEPSANPCRTPDTLTKGTGDCEWLYTMTNPLPLDGYSSPGHFRDLFELRLQNNTFKQLNVQLDQIKTLASFVRTIDMDVVKKQLKPWLTKLKTRDPKLFKWMDSKLNGAEDKTLLTDLKAAYANSDKCKQMIKSLDTVADYAYATTLLDKRAIAYLLDFTWFTGGKYLTANPVAGPATDYKSQLDSATKALTNANRALTDVNQDIGIVENVSKGTGTACCGINNLYALKRSEDSLLTRRAAINNNIDQLTKTVGDLKSQLGKNKPPLMADSLFYSGYFTISPTFGSDLTDPNKPELHFMRNHNALNDYSPFDLKRQSEINESQHIEAIAVNQNPKTKVIIKTTYSAATNEMDFLSTGLTATTVNAYDAGTQDKTLDDIYKAYQSFSNITLPYQNGILPSPVIGTRDTLARYISKSNITPDPDQLPAKGSYAFMDSTGTKNLNTQGTTFAFRINRLYRFRLTAGIAYSWLERKTYTINSATNTASYTTNYAGMAPSFGIQIFTKKLDIQKTSFLPAGIWPYFYAGYMFHDAPANNFLFGVGEELLSGLALTAGVHLGKTQGLTLSQGNLVEKDSYKGAWFLSLSFGIEAFTAIFSPAKTIVNPNVK